jgi:hypothetical protein
MLSIKQQIMDALARLSLEQQNRVLELAQALGTTTLPPGTSGETLLAHAGDFHFEPGELDAMIQAIEDGCERIDADGW